MANETRKKKKKKENIIEIEEPIDEERSALVLPKVDSPEDFYVNNLAQIRNAMFNMPNNEEERRKLFTEFFNVEEIRGKTELKRIDVETLTRLQVYANFLNRRYGLNVRYIDELIDIFCLFMISHERKGRLEFVKSVESKVEYPEQMLPFMPQNSPFCGNPVMGDTTPPPPNSENPSSKNRIVRWFRRE